MLEPPLSGSLFSLWQPLGGGDSHRTSGGSTVPQSVSLSPAIQSLAKEKVFGCRETPCREAGPVSLPSSEATTHTGQETCSSRMVPIFSGHVSSDVPLKA